MNAVNFALSQGHEASDILHYLIRQFPKYSKEIRSALKSGYSAKQIIDHIGKKGEGVHSSMTEHEKTQLSDKEKKKTVKKNLAKGVAVAGAIGGGLAYRAYQAAKGITRVFPEVLPALQGQQQEGDNRGVEIDLTPRITHQPKLISNEQNQPPQIGFNNPSPQQPPPSPIPSSAPPSPQDPSTSPGPSQPTPQQPITDHPRKQILADLFQSLKIKEPIENTARDSDPQTVKTLARFILGNSKVKQVEKQYGESLDNLIDEYISYGVPPGPERAQFGKKAPISPEIAQPIQTTEKISTPTEEDFEQEPEESKENFVALPDGTLGKLAGVNKGIAKVDTGKGIRHRKEKEIITSPIPEKDLHKLYDELVEGIQKKTGEEVSRMVEWAGYDPETNELAFIPHLGGLYVYDDISPQDANQLTNILSKRKSTGENHIGVWTKDSKSPIGAEMSKLIKKLQKERGGKGKEYKGKFSKIYDALEPAKLSSKEEYEREKRKTKKPRPD